MNLKRTTLTLLAACLAFGGTLTHRATAGTEPLPGLPMQPDEYFYTGKPYDADLDAHLFLYRNYSPEIARWTSADPSGFPDGANAVNYGPTPTFQYDYCGLHTQTYTTIMAVDGNGTWKIHMDFTVQYDASGISLFDYRLSGRTSGQRSYPGGSMSFEAKNPNVKITESELGPYVNSNGALLASWNFTIEGFATLAATSSGGTGNISLFGFSINVGESSTHSHTLHKEESFSTNLFEVSSIE